MFIKSAMCSSLIYLLTHTSLWLVLMHLQLNVECYLRLFVFFLKKKRLLKVSFYYVTTMDVGVVPLQKTYPAGVRISTIFSRTIFTATSVGVSLRSTNFSLLYYLQHEYCSPRDALTWSVTFNSPCILGHLTSLHSFRILFVLYVVAGAD